MALTMGVISVHSYCRISILFSLVNIILLEEQQSTLIVYHGCISLYTRRLSATLLEKPGGATRTIPHIMAHTVQGPSLVPRPEDEKAWDRG